jgi:hypothetical protein
MRRPVDVKAHFFFDSKSADTSWKKDRYRVSFRVHVELASTEEPSLRFLRLEQTNCLKALGSMLPFYRTVCARRVGWDRETCFRERVLPLGLGLDLRHHVWLVVTHPLQSCRPDEVAAPDPLMQEGVAFGFLILGHKKATLPSQRGAVVAPKQRRTCSGTTSEWEGTDFSGKRTSFTPRSGFVRVKCAQSVGLRGMREARLFAGSIFRNRVKPPDRSGSIPWVTTSLS